MMAKQSIIIPEQHGIILRGYKRKLKTMKKKFFVLFKETASNCARLEYFDNEKKFNSGSTPKRVLKLQNCFNINRRLDSKHDFVIALSMKEGCFGIVLESEAEITKWLETLIRLKQSESFAAQSSTYFDHVWQVAVQRKGMAEEQSILGRYHVCLTPISLTFIRIDSHKQLDKRVERIEFLLTTIRRCGDSQCFFYMEVGRQSITGSGELWMETEDALIAQNMHTTILSAMSSRIEKSVDPMRKRSSSANEASKPILMLPRKHTQVGNKASSSSHQTECLSYGRERCGSLPSSRNITSSDCSNQSFLNARSSQPGLTNMIHAKNLHQRPDSQRPPVNAACCLHNEETFLSIDDEKDVLVLPLRHQLTREKPMRSYSTGSRLECNRIKEFNTRERTFSLGPSLQRNRKYCGLFYVHNNYNCSNNNDEISDEIRQHKHTNYYIKSTSVPYLINNQKSYGMSNLMEMDFSKNSLIHITHITNSNNLDHLAKLNMHVLKSSLASFRCNKYIHLGRDYLEMKPVNFPSNQVNAAVNQNHAENVRTYDNVLNESVLIFPYTTKQKANFDNQFGVFNANETYSSLATFKCNDILCSHSQYSLVDSRTEDNEKISINIINRHAVGLKKNKVLNFEYETYKKMHSNDSDELTVYRYLHLTDFCLRQSNKIYLYNKEEVKVFTNSDTITSSNNLPVLSPKRNYSIDKCSTTIRKHIQDSDYIKSSIIPTFKKKGSVLENTKQNFGDSVPKIVDSNILYSQKVVQLLNSCKVDENSTKFEQTYLNLYRMEFYPYLSISCICPSSASVEKRTLDESNFCLRNNSKLIDNLALKQNSSPKLHYASLDLKNCPIKRSYSRKKNRRFNRAVVNVSPSLQLKNMQSDFSYVKINFDN